MGIGLLGLLPGHPGGKGGAVLSSGDMVTCRTLLPPVEVRRVIILLYPALQAHITYSMVHLDGLPDGMEVI